MTQKTDVDIEDALIRSCIEASLEIMLVDFKSVDVWKDNGTFQIRIETKEK